MTGGPAHSGRRLVILGVLLASLMAVLAARLGQLVFVRGADLASAAEGNSTRHLPDPAPRGLIVDSSGRPLVGNTPVAAVAIDRQRLNAQPGGGDRVIAAVAQALGMSTAQLRQRLTTCGSPGAPPRPVCDDGSSAAPVIVTARGDGTDVLRLAERPDAYPGVTVTGSVRRTYPFGGITGGHLLGFLGQVSAQEIADSSDDDVPLTMYDSVGRGGLEQAYDRDLRGVPGSKVVLVDSVGRMQGTRETRAPVAGNNLVTSIDARVQQRTEAELAAALARAGSPDARAAAVVLEAATGRVIAIASAPDLDPREWVTGLSQQRYTQLQQAGALVDYAAQALQPPGSVFKPITVTAMIRQGERLDGTYDCPTSYRAGDRSFTNHDGEQLGRISLARALEVSCNTVFYRAGDRMWSAGGGERSGAGEIDPIARSALDFGLGAPTGIDLPGEATGMVASPDNKYRSWQSHREQWCANAESRYPQTRLSDPAQADYLTAIAAENCAAGDRWRRGDAILAAIGQGDTVATPLQMASVYAAIANGGIVVRPTIARAVVAGDGTMVREIPTGERGRLTGDEATLAWLRRSLRGVVSQGTAAPAFSGFPLDAHPVAGKTGTAQVQGKAPTSWFASMAPAGDPKYVVVAMVTEGGAGGGNAAPVARGIYETIFGVGTRAAFPPDGPPQDLPRVTGVRR